MKIGSVSCHDPDPTDVRLTMLGHGQCCLRLDAVELYGSADKLAAVLGRAVELLARERGVTIAVTVECSSDLDPDLDPALRRLARIEGWRP